MENKKLNVKMISEDIISAKINLNKYGWTILSKDMTKNGAREILASFGEIIPQLDGKDIFEVKANTAFSRLPFSQSVNYIGPHTEAPVYDPPPKYLALYCHRQAQCGGGHTLMSDGYAFCEKLDLKMKKWIEGSVVEFSATALPGDKTKKYIQTSIMQNKNGEKIFRFSYNQFYFGDVNPSISHIENTKNITKHDKMLINFAKLGEEFFYKNVISVLIPESTILIWDNHRLMHARNQYKDKNRHLTRYWLKNI